MANWRAKVGLAGCVLVLSGCGSAPESASTPQPSVTASSASQLGLTGTLFFHRYSDYEAWDSQLFGLDLVTGTLVEVSKPWTTVISPMNAHISADGQHMVFMGSAAGLSENDWDVFTSTWNGTTWDELVNLTGPNGMRDEDPKFSPDGAMIAYKNNGVLATMNSDGSNKQLLTIGAPESSIPYFTADGSGIIFDREGSIWLRTADGTEKVLWQAGATKAYYPVGVDAERFLFTEVQASHHEIGRAHV